MSEKKIFDEYEVDCNTCERYWLSQCDGVKPTPEGSKTPCNSFLATRNVIIPKQIEALQKSVLRLSVGVVILGICVILLAIG